MIKLTIGSQNVNADMTESDFDSFVSFVADRIDERTGLTVQVDSSFGGSDDVITRATAEEADTVSEAVQALWVEWCETATVTVGGYTGPIDAVAVLMDDEIRESLHGRYDGDAQGFVDAYCAAHRAKFGESFAVV